MEKAKPQEETIFQLAQKEINHNEFDLNPKPAPENK
jgi:hypothetical protein